MTSYSVGVVGCTGAVGKELVRLLGERSFPVSRLALFASERSAGRRVDTPFGPATIAAFTLAAARACDVVFLAVSGAFARRHARAIAAQPGGAIVIDNSSALRLEPDVPLVVPEINPEALAGARLVANPNCTTAIAAVALWPLHRLAGGLESVVVSTYQAASGAGAAGMAELVAGSRAALAACPPGSPVSLTAATKAAAADNKVFAHPLPFNVIPHIDTFQDNGPSRAKRSPVAEHTPI